ncbi:TnsD family Tn7-like transposition protein [Spartinivicinus ruber]|uniref:TnsD family Tn7-like transposition protein n=1 Tax=Spartinivicinus ruber TaxID=2683272 RepID=UPI0013D5B012|nr:TnsD family Tn7-like transposition protein [Spartinivicinus ruber]
MVAYFPCSYPDELLYSLIARYGAHTGQENQKAIIQDLFNSKTVVAVPDFPSHLPELVKSTNTVWQTSVDEIIQNHTLAPLYLPFIAPENSDKVLISMKSTYGGNIHTRLGVAASSIKTPTYFRHCPYCIEDQQQQYGEAYWKRIHQIPGIAVCHQHSVPLIETAIFFHPKAKHLYVLPPQKMFGLPNSTIHLSKKEWAVIELINQLLSLPIGNKISQWQWTQFYRWIATHRGMIKGSRINHSQIVKHVVQDWQNSLFRLQVEYCLEQSDSWLVNLFRKHRKSFHPLRHTLVWQSFLPEDDAVDIIEQVQQFSKVPEIAKPRASTKKPSTAAIQDKRKQWLKVMTKHPGMGVKALRQQTVGGALYAWLYKHDQAWLRKNKPERVSPKQHYGANWRKRDLSTIRQLKALLAELIKSENYPQLTKTFLIHQLDMASTIEKHLADLPKSNQWLNKHCESTENYQIRRLQKEAQELTKSGENVIVWKLERKAGLHREKLTKKVKTIIKKLEGTGKSGK